MTVEQLRERLRKLPGHMLVVVAHPAAEPNIDDVREARVIKDSGQTEEDVLVIEVAL